MNLAFDLGLFLADCIFAEESVGLNKKHRYLRRVHDATFLQGREQFLVILGIIGRKLAL